MENLMESFGSLRQAEYEAPMANEAFTWEEVQSEEFLKRVIDLVINTTPRLHNIHLDDSIYETFTRLAWEF